MSAEQGVIKVKALLTLLIGQTLNFFSVGKSMSDIQIAQTIDLILEDYAVYKPDYFILCFNRAKKGKYGKSYDRIDGQIIFEWLAQFDYEYTSEIEHARINEKKKLEKDIGPPDSKLIEDPKNKPVPMPDYIKESMVKMLFRPVSVNILPSRTPEQMLVDGFINDFNEIVDANTYKGGKRFVFFYGMPGRTMDITEYIEYRITGGGKVALIPKT